MERDNYEIMKGMARDQFASYDIEEIARRMSLEIQDGFLKFKLFDIPFRVNTSNALVENIALDVCGEHGLGSEFVESNANAAGTAYDVLGFSDVPVFPMGVLVNMESLSPARGLGATNLKGLFGDFAHALDGHDAELAQALETMGGTPEGKGDVSFSLPFFKGFRCMFQFWDGDDEFEPAIQIFWDGAITSLMHFETVWYANLLLKERLQSLMPGLEGE